jgi:hypothetical protein
MGGSRPRVCGCRNPSRGEPFCHRASGGLGRRRERDCHRGHLRGRLRVCRWEREGSSWSLRP